MVTEQNKDDLLAALYHRGASDIKRNVMLQGAKLHLEGWDNALLVDTADALIADGLLVHRTNSYVALTIAGLRNIEAKIHPASNVTHNTINADKITNSPIQQTGAYSIATQSTNYNSQDFEKLRGLISLFANHIDDLALNATSKTDALAEIDTIKAQLAKSKPNSSFIKEAGRSLKNITEGAIGSLLAEAIKNPATWQGIHQLMAQLF